MQTDRSREGFAWPPVFLVSRYSIVNARHENFVAPRRK